MYIYIYTYTWILDPGHNREPGTRTHICAGSFMCSVICTISVLSPNFDPYPRIEPAHFFGVDCTGCFKLVCESCQLKNNLLMTMDVDITAYDSLGKMFLGKDVFDEDII